MAIKYNYLSDDIYIIKFKLTLGYDNVIIIFK